eukprot:jgi/Astpho2/2445/fgenesh1_pg.00044_%23_65_t
MASIPRPANRFGSAPPKQDFNAVRVPSNYVPGLGRGATGFTTRSDIGPARPGVPGAEGAAGAQEQPVDENKFDEFMGNDAGAFASNVMTYDEDDKEADEVWDQIDEYMDGRRRDRREKRMEEELKKYRTDNPKLTEQFADLKRKLGDVNEDEWNSIPEIGDYTVKKRPRMESFVPVPDTLLARAAEEKKSTSAVLDAQPGLSTPASGLQTNLTEIGAGRRAVMSLGLDKMADSVTGQTVVDPKGYMTDMSSLEVKSDAEIGDIKKARTLLKSVINTNPRHAPGWVAAARLEEVAGRHADARQLIQKGCDMCPGSEDVWLEAARLQTPENAKAVLARGVAANPTSARLWMQAACLEQAARLEQDTAAKSRVLRKALERQPESVRLWKAAVELATEEDARVLLSRAVECCPQHVELWLALARLETYDNARKVLNRARLAVPTSAAIWINAAKLEEANGNAKMVDKIIERAIKSLTANSVVISRDKWLEEAEGAEKSQPPMLATCRSIVKSVVEMGVEDQDRWLTWEGDAADATRKGAYETARAIYAHALSVFPGDEEIWRAAASMEKQHGTREGLDALLKKAVTYCPQAEVFWLMAAKEQWKEMGNVPAARQILAEAFAANPDSEGIWLAAFKLEFENHEPERARAILEKAREGTSSTQKVWMKSALVERELGNNVAERRMLDEGLKRFPYFDKLWLMLGQLEERQGRTEAARQVYSNGIRRCINSIPLWRSAAALEERAGAVGRARALLEQARLKNPKAEEAWLAGIRTEQRAGNTKAAEAVMAKALQELPDSGMLWAEAITMAPRPQRKSKSADALKRVTDSPLVVAAVAQLFVADRKVDKARSWFQRAVTLGRDIGDVWAQYLKFETQLGKPETAAAIVEECKKAEPKYGERWQRVAKHPANAHQPIDKILRLVVTDVDTQPAP